MRKLSFYASILALFGGTAAMLPNPSQPIQRDVTQASSGAFRDGLYLGKLAAERGSRFHLLSGRWATAGDRELFAAGYQQGYRESLGNREPVSPSGRQAD